MGKPKKSEINIKEIETKQYSISYYLHGGHKIDIAACLTDEKLKIFINSFSGNKKAPKWMQQLFQSGMYIINLSNVILVEIKDAVPNTDEQLVPIPESEVPIKEESESTISPKNPIAEKQEN